MITAIVLGLSASAQTPTETVLQLTLEGGAFVLKRGTQTEKVPLSMSEKTPKFVAFRKDQTWAVWDERGLTVRVGANAKSFKLKEVPVSPRVFEREEIRKNLEQFKAGNRSQEASACSGARRIGNEVYFLARWDDKEKKPWLEALVKVDMATTKPEWKLVGRFEGLSLGEKSIDDKLLLHNGSLAVILRRGEEWGESFYSSHLGGFGFKKVGKGLASFKESANGSGGSFVEKTSYGNSIAGEVDIENGARTEVAEVKGDFTLLDGAKPLLGFTKFGGPVLRNGASGSEFNLPKDAGVRRTSSGVLIWSPVSAPETAVLYDPERWTPLLRWVNNGKPAVSKPAPKKSEAATSKPEEDERP